MKIRLLQVMLAPGEGGAETFFEKLAIAFQEAGIEQKLVICRHAERRRRLESAGCKVVEIPARGWRKWLAKRAVRRVAEDFQPTIQIAWMSRAAAALTRMDGCVNLARLGGYYPLKYYRECELLIGNTPGVLDYLKEAGWPEQKMRLISNFGELTERPDQAQVERMRAEFKIQEDQSVIVTMGRLHRNKAQDVLIRALAQVPGAVLLIAGVGALEDQLKSLAVECGVAKRVHFLGWRRDAENLFALADLCLFPSRAEPLGNVVLEAWAARVPIAAAASEGPSWLIDHEANGLLFPVDDVSACAEAARRLIDEPDLTHRCVEGGFSKWRSAFSRKAVVEQYLELFRKLED